MAYIYKIINNINGKIYIGKTEFSIEKRFAEHCRDAFNNKYQNRPLYKAMQKYGIENFSVEMIEKTNEPETKEKYWIEYFGSFKNGYNATMGGDGARYADYDLIYRLYQSGKSCGEIHAITKYDHITIQHALESYNITKEERIKNGIAHLEKPVAKLDIKSEEILEVYCSTAEAERHNGNTKHIADVCNGKRKTCKGFKWKYL